MQKPFQLSEAMQEELEAVEKLADLQIPEPARVADLVSIRRQTHGNFRDNARVSQMLKSVMRATTTWEHLDDIEKEALDMIASRISRILSGKSLLRQHWEGIEECAHLVTEECE